MSTAIVTGGAGFLGTNFCQSLVKYRTDIVRLNNPGIGWQADAAHLNVYRGLSFFKGYVPGSIRPQVDAAAGDRDIDHVYHFASPVDFDDYEIETARSNSKWMRNALKVARDQNATILFVLTSEMYGEPIVHLHSGYYCSNVSLHNPRAPYDEAKGFSETLCTTYRREFDVDTQTVMTLYKYSLRIRPDDGRIVSTSWVQALRGNSRTIHGDGEQTQSFLLMGCLIRVVRRLAERFGLTGEVANVGHTDEVSIREFADIVAWVASTDVGVVHQPRPEGNSSLRRRDISKIADRLDWKPSVDLKTGLERALEYFEQEAVDADT